MAPSGMDNARRAAAYRGQTRGQLTARQRRRIAKKAWRDGRVAAKTELSRAFREFGQRVKAARDA
jgi:hypothetical protein